MCTDIDIIVDGMRAFVHVCTLLYAWYPCMRAFVHVCTPLYAWNPHS